LKKLPAKARKIWEAAYKSAKKQYGPERASKIAWAIVKKKYKKKDDKWVAKERAISIEGPIELKSEQLVCRSEDTGDLSKDYFFEGVLATTNETMQDNDIYTPELLTKLAEEIKNYPINIKGDLEHVNSRMKRGMKVEDNLPTYDDFIKIEDTKVDGDKLWIRGKLDKYADNFPVIWHRIQEGFYDGLSIELFVDKNNAKLVNRNGRMLREISGGRINKFALTSKPKDKYSRVTKSYTK